MDTSSATQAYTGGKIKRLPPDMSRLFQEVMAKEFKTAGQGSAAIAAKLGYSAIQIRRLFVQQLGESLGSFCSRLRFEQAAGRLALETVSVKEIAKQTGYGSSQAFDKGFKAHFGCTPSIFRSLNNSGCRFPGYLLWRGQYPKWERNVKVKTGPQTKITFMYDGPVFLGRVFSDGRIDWTVP